MKHFIITGLFAATLLSACSNDMYEGIDRAGAKLNITGTINNALTRVATNGLSSSWEDGDAIGLYTANNGTDFANTKYTTDGTGSFKAAAGDIYLLSEGEVTLNAYYPYKENNELSNGIYPFSIKDDNNTYVPNDFMFATTSVARGAEDETTTSLRFSHKMNRMVLNLKVEDPQFTVKEGDAVTYTLRDIVTDGMFNTITGAVTAETATDKVIFSSTYGSPVDLIYIPQVKKDVELLIKIGDKYLSAIIPSLASAAEESGYSYTYTITKTQSKVTVKLENTSINDWNTGQGGDIESEEKEQETTSSPSVGDWNAGGSIEMTEQN